MSIEISDFYMFFPNLISEYFPDTKLTSFGFPKWYLFNDLSKRFYKRDDLENICSPAELVLSFVGDKWMENSMKFSPRIIEDAS